jgi:protein TonB
MKKLWLKFNNITTEKKILFLTVVSLFLHAFVLSFHYDITSSFKQVASPKAKKEKKIKIVFKTKSKKKKMQMVTADDKGKKKKPLDAKFFSKRNQVVDRQTVAKSIGKYNKAGKGSKQAPMKKQVAAKVADKKIGKKKTARRGKGKKRKAKIALSDLFMGKMAVVKPQPKRAPSAARGLKNGDASSSGLAKNNDYIEEIPLGDFTSLNTVENKYYGFYFRIKQRLEQHWGRTLRKKAEKLFKSGRRMPASENKITSLKVILDDTGNIVDVIVKGTSGVTELDDAAVESFNQAGPFPNPPKGMIKNGHAQIEWGFVVKG